MKTLQLNLLVSLIMESVKGETLIKGRIDKAVDDKAAALAYNEEAGDEAFHERKLERTMHTSLSKLLSKIGDYVGTASSSSGNNVFSNIAGDALTISIVVSDRFNESFTDPLAKLCSKFIEDHMLFLWWGTFNVKQAEFYKALYEMDLQDIMNCFAKTSPYIPTTSYTSEIKPSEYIRTHGNSIRASVGETFSVTYTTDDGTVDDVQVRTDGANIAYSGKVNQTFHLLAKYPGACTLTLYSKHDEDVNCDITVIVS